MDRLRRECGQTNGDVLRTIGARRAVADPLAFPYHDGLSGMDIECTRVRFHLQRPFQDDGVFVERGCLTWLAPASGASHRGDAHRGFAAVDMSNVLVDPLGLVAGRPP